MAQRRKLTKEERQTIYDKTGGHCAYCGKEISLGAMQVDHMIPIDMYDAYKTIGQDLNDMENLLPACRSCNHYKHTLTVEKFRDLIQRGPEILARDSVAYRTAVRFGTVKPNPKRVVFYFERAAQGDGIPKIERVEFG